MRCFSLSWLREFVDDPYRGHVALVEFLQYLHLHQPSPEVDDVPKRKGKPDVLSRDFVSIVKYLHLNKGKVLTKSSKQNSIDTGGKSKLQLKNVPRLKVMPPKKRRDSAKLYLR